MKPESTTLFLTAEAVDYVGELAWKKSKFVHSTEKVKATVLRDNEESVVLLPHPPYSPDLAPIHLSVF